MIKHGRPGSTTIDIEAEAGPHAKRRRGQGWTAPRPAAPAPPMDAVDKAIVKMLQVDGRTPYKEVADALGVSEGTVRNRVGRMKERGVLRIVAVADPTAINYRADAMLGVKVAPGVTPEQVAGRLAEFSQTVYVLWVSGRYDLLVEIVCESDEDFLGFVAANIYDQTDIAGVEIMTGLAMFKNQFLLKREFS